MRALQRQAGAHIRREPRQGCIRRLEVFQGAEQKLKDLEKRNPSVHFELLERRQPSMPSQQYDSAMEALFEGAALAVVVVFIFLRDFRATVISALAIPLSAIPTFWFMDMMRFTLNQMTPARARRWSRVCWSTTRSSRSKISCATYA